MNPKTKSAIWFALSFFASFGSYCVISLIFHWNSFQIPNNLNFSRFIMAPFTALIYACICIPAFLILRKKNKWLAKGFVWSLLGIVVYLYTLGGCGMVPIY